MHALVQIDALRFTPMTLVSAEGLELAHGSARRAVELAPDSGRAHLALAMALFFRGEVGKPLAAGAVAARLGRQDPDLLGEFGVRNIFSANREVGTGFVRRPTGLAEEHTVRLPRHLRQHTA